jgi:catechol 2,3-dioxygenase-like lactoylglutathione lyase family enzyme
LLRNSKPRTGAFSRLFGDSEIELVQVQGRTPRKIFEGRFWGDLGFIHLCYDINGMEELNAACAKRGFAFTVDSFAHHEGISFDMGEAAGHFAYIEDPDGTLIEFVETHKLPIFKKFGIYLNMQKRNPTKNLPTWILKSLSLSRVKK